MKIPLVSVCAVATLAAAVTFVCAGRPPPADAATPTAHAEGTKLLGRLPVAFVPNLGQWEHAARFVAKVGAMTVFLEEKGWTFTLVEPRALKEKGAEGEDASARGVAVRMTFAGASAPALVAEDRLPGRHNYFLGNDPARWRSDVPLNASVRYREVQPGVDVCAREHDGHFEYDLLLQPEAELEPVEITVEGIEKMHLDGDGALVLETRLGPVRMPAPRSWEDGPSGERIPISVRYVLRGKDRFGFEVPGRRAGWALVVDPGLVWSTFLGGTRDYEYVAALALDAQGACTVAGNTVSSDFPTTPGAFDTSYYGGFDAFVTRLSAAGSSLVYSTFLGGFHHDYANAVALDAQGACTVAGYTVSTDFPTTPGTFDTSHNNGADGFITRLSPLGSSLVYSTFLGGTDHDQLHALALDAQGVATVAGGTLSADFPTTLGAFDTSYNGGTLFGGDALVTRLSATGSSLIYSTFLGGTSHESTSAVALDAQGAVTVAGGTSSTDFPTTPGAFDTSYNGGSANRGDAFVTCLSSSGSILIYSTFLGGTAGDGASSLALDAQGAATVAGVTYSATFPTTPGAFDTSHNGGSPFGVDAFVTRLSPLGSSLVYSTFLGGTSDDQVNALALDAQGAATVAGASLSTDFPTTLGAFDTNYNGGGTYGGDAFVARLSPLGASLVYSTFLGGTGEDFAFALALDAKGACTVAGTTESTGFPTTSGAFDTSYNGYGDAYVTRLDMLPTGVSAYGRSSPGCTGPLAISVTSMPQVGNANFALTCGNAPPSTTGVLALTADGFVNPFILLGVEVWVDPMRLFLQLPATSNTIGASEVPLPIPNGPWLRGTTLFAQFFWAGPTSPPPCPPLGLSASHMLGFTIQP